MSIDYPGAVAPARSRFVSSFGLRLHVCEWGDERAEPVLLLHGFYDHGRGFDLLAPLLAERYRVLALDARGHGDSDWADEYSWFCDVLDVVNVLRDLGRPAHLVGHSRGGGQATDVASLFPRDVRTLADLDGFGPPPEGFRAAAGTARQWLAEFFDWRLRNGEHATFRPLKTLDEMAARRRAQNPRLSNEWLRYFVAHGSRPTDEGFVWKVDPLASRGTGPFRPEWIAPGWARLRVPMLALVGSEPDTWGPLPEPLLSERLSYVPRLERAVVRGAGHFMHIEQPAQTADLLLAFLEKDA